MKQWTFGRVAWIASPWILTAFFFLVVIGSAFAATENETTGLALTTLEAATTNRAGTGFIANKDIQILGFYKAASSTATNLELYNATGVANGSNGVLIANVTYSGTFANLTLLNINFDEGQSFYVMSGANGATFNRYRNSPSAGSNLQYNRTNVAFVRGLCSSNSVPNCQGGTDFAADPFFNDWVYEINAILTTDASPPAPPTSNFTITANNSVTGTALTSFSANVTLNGTVYSYSTTSSYIVTNITANASTIVNVTVGAANYFENVTLNHATDTNLSVTMLPYTRFFFYDMYNGTVLNQIPYGTFDLSINGGTVKSVASGDYVAINTSTYNVTASKTGSYFPVAELNQAVGVDNNLSFFQAEARFDATEVISGAAVTGFGVNATLQYNDSSTPTLYLTAGTYNLTFNKTGWYNKTVEFTVPLLSNATYTFSDVYQYLLNTSVQNAVNGSFLSNFTVLVQSGLYTYNGTASTTNGSVVLPWVADTNANVSLINHPDYANASELVNVTGSSPLQVNVTLDAHRQNTVQFFFRDASTGNLLAVATNVTLLGSTATYAFNTTNGTYFAEALNQDTYTVLIEAAGYELNRALLTTAGDYQVATYYVDSATQSATFSVEDTLGNSVENATVTFAQNINGTVVTYAQIVTDLSGLFSLNLNPSISYIITSTHANYQTFAGTIQPSQSITYVIRMNFPAGDEYGTALNDTYYAYDVDYDANASTANVTFEVINSAGALDYWGMMTSYNGVNYSQNITGVPGGGIANFTVTGIDLDIQDYVNVTFWLKRTSFEEITFSQVFRFRSVTPENTTVTTGAFGDDKAPSSAWGKALLATLIVLVGFAGVYQLTSVYQAAAIAAIALIALFALPSIAWLPLVYSLLAIGTITIILVGDAVAR